MEETKAGRSINRSSVNRVAEKLTEDAHASVISIIETERVTSDGGSRNWRARAADRTSSSVGCEPDHDLRHWVSSRISQIRT